MLLQHVPKAYERAIESASLPFSPWITSSPARLSRGRPVALGSRQRSGTRVLLNEGRRVARPTAHPHEKQPYVPPPEVELDPPTLGEMTEEIWNGMINYWRAARGALGIVPGLHRPGLRAILHRTLVVAALIVVFTVAVCVVDVLAAESVFCGSAVLNKVLQRLTG